MAEITLKINGKNKKFKKDVIPFRARRKAMVFDKISTNPDIDQIEKFDKQAELIVDMFDNQFTLDEFLDGFDNAEANDKIYELIAVHGLGYPSLEEANERMGKLLEMEKEAENLVKSEEQN